MFCRATLDELDRPQVWADHRERLSRARRQEDPPDRVAGRSLVDVVVVQDGANVSAVPDGNGG